MNFQELTGRARSHLVALDDPSCELHHQVTTPFLRLRAAARTAGFDLRPVSVFRDFERQLAIWNGKFAGTRPLLDAAGQPLLASKLPPRERIDAILRWSALPGASRHHWGTEFDLMDANAVPADYRVQLLPAEFAAGGPFGALDAWLQMNACRFGFFRPYRGVVSGAQSEPWHYSFAPLSEPARRALTPGVLRDVLAEAPLEGRDAVLPRLEELHARYVAGIDLP